MPPPRQRCFLSRRAVAAARGRRGFGPGGNLKSSARECELDRRNQHGCATGGGKLPGDPRLARRRSPVAYGIGEQQDRRAVGGGDDFANLRPTVIPDLRLADEDDMGRRPAGIRRTASSSQQRRRSRAALRSRDGAGIRAAVARRRSAAANGDSEVQRRHRAAPLRRLRRAYSARASAGAASDARWTQWARFRRSEADSPAPMGRRNSQHSSPTRLAPQTPCRGASSASRRAHFAATCCYAAARPK
jgi:hypothetical protein